MATVLEKRVQRTLDTLHLIGNRSVDIETPEQADKVEAALIAQVEATMARLRGVKSARPKFSL